MNFLLYVVLFIIFSPKFFMVLGGRRVASVSMTDILFHALLFALGLYVVGYLTRTYHMFEGFADPSSTPSTPVGPVSCPADILDKKSKYKTKKLYMNFLKKLPINKILRKACEDAY